MTDTLSTNPSTEQECTVEFKMRLSQVAVRGTQSLCKYAVTALALAGTVTIVLVTIVKALAEIKETEITTRHDYRGGSWSVGS